MPTDEAVLRATQCSHSYGVSSTVSSSPALLRPPILGHASCNGYGNSCGFPPSTILKLKLSKSSSTRRVAPVIPVHASHGNTYEINLNEYMLTLDKPLGIRFAQNLDGKVFVDALAKNGNAERSKMVMVGDILKKTSADSGDAMWGVEDINRTINAIRHRNGSVNLILERPSVSVPIHPPKPDREYVFNCGRVCFVTWNGGYLSKTVTNECDNQGKVGFATFCPHFLNPVGLKLLAKSGVTRQDVRIPSYEILRYFTDEDRADIEWRHGDFSLENYAMAQQRSEKDLCYNHSLGMQITKITGDIFIGSCMQTVADAHSLSKDLGITAVLNFQSKSEQENWGIDGGAIRDALRKDNVLIIDYPIREVDSVDLRRKLPSAVAILYRLLRQEHRVLVTCTTGLDRSPACVIGYLHWIRDVALQDAIDFVQSMHPCGPDRPALVWTTWDLVAMAERGKHKGPPTHSVQFVWNHGCREGEEVLLVGDFKGEWNEPIKAVHAGGPKYVVDLRLPQGKYYFKFIVGGQWRHSHTLPTEVDQYGNVNNVIHVGGVASTNVNDLLHSNMKSVNNIKVIERPLTEDERFTLAFAARRMAFSISPLNFSPKR